MHVNHAMHPLVPHISSRQLRTLMSSVGLDRAAARPPLREPAATLTASGVLPALLLLLLLLGSLAAPTMPLPLLPASVVTLALMGLYSPSRRPALQQWGASGAALAGAGQMHRRCCACQQPHAHCCLPRSRTLATSHAARHLASR